MMAVVVAVTVTATVAVAVTITSICLSTFGLQVLGTVLFVSGYFIIYHMAYHTRSRVDRSRTPPRDSFSLAGALIARGDLLKPSIQTAVEIYGLD